MGTNNKLSDKYCDLVMEGGVVSGIVFPGAIKRLSEKYQFRNIGGTSAGAIAAAFAASAEYYRRNNGGSEAKFDEILEICKQLSESINGKTKLSGLFQSNQKTKRIFNILNEFLKPSSFIKKIVNTIYSAIKEYIYKLISFLSLLVIFDVIVLVVNSFGVEGFHAIQLFYSTIGILSLLLSLLVLSVLLVEYELIFYLLITFLSIFLIALSVTNPEILVLNLIQLNSLIFAILSLLVLFVLVVPFVVAVFYRDITKNLTTDQQAFGLCTGMPEAGITPNDPKYWSVLTPWLHKHIQELAGGETNNDPLIFSDLWNISKEQNLAFSLRADLGCTNKDSLMWQKFKCSIPKCNHPFIVKSINLQFVTTNVTHGRPYLLPHKDIQTSLFFRKVELESFFPANVLTFMEQNSRSYAEYSIEATEANINHPLTPLYNDLRELPYEKLPIIVAVRMSLSHPLLLSAIPLYAINHGLLDPTAGKIERCWFSDGGLSSNFPIHFFDKPLPPWPTFGLAFEDISKEEIVEEIIAGDPQYNGSNYDKWIENHPRKFIYMPRNNKGYGQDIWNKIDSGTGSDKLFSYATAIINSMYKWNDNSILKMADVRDRVVRIYLDKDTEGGLNLNMPREVIERLMQRGTIAGRKLITRYHPTNREIERPMGWKKHQWTRFNTLIDMLADQFDELDVYDVNSLNSHIMSRIDQEFSDYNFNEDDIATLLFFVLILRNAGNTTQLRSFLNSSQFVANSDRPYPKSTLRPRTF